MPKIRPQDAPEMKRLIYLTVLATALTSTEAQQVRGLSSAKSVYENIESIAVKRDVPPVASYRKIPYEELSNSAKLMADEHLSAPGNVALMLIDKGNIVFEGYSKGANERHRLVSMSMAKSLTSLALGEALCAGKIESLNDTAEKYAPEIRGLTFGKTKIVDLLKMTSGVKTSPVYHGNPYPTSGDDLIFHRVSTLELLKKYDNSDSVSIFGNPWNYSNLDTDTLNYVIRGSTGMSLGDWYSSTIAKKAGLENKSYWGIDSKGIDIAPSLYFATMRDWARIALYIRDAYRNHGDSCIPKYIQQATKRQVQALSPEFNSYGYQFFVSNKSTPMNDFWMVGFAGQRIGFNMAEDKIIINFSWAPDAEKTYTFFRNWVKL